MKKQKQRDQAEQISTKRIERLSRAILALQSDQQKEEVTCFLIKIGQAFEIPVEKIFAQERLEDLDQKIAQASQKVGQMLPLLKDEKKLSIEDFLTLESKEDYLEQLKRQREKGGIFDPETLC